MYYGMALSVRPSVRPVVITQKYRRNGPFFFKFGVQMYLGVPLINLWLVQSYLIWYVHNDLISDFSIFSIRSVILFKLEPSNFAHFENLSCC